MARVALFDPCYMATLRPGEAEHAVHVLEALGDEVTLLDGICCGQPAFNSGFRTEARTVGRAALKAGRAFEAVVVTSGSCTSMVRHYLPMLYDGDRRLAAGQIAGRFVDFPTYVATHPRRPSLYFKLQGAVSYHDACHTRREVGSSQHVIALLESIEGLEVRRLAHEEECCGFGGSFSVKLPEVSVAMMTAKLDDIGLAGARIVTSADYSCLAHLEAGAEGIGLQFEAWTLAELLARALS
ncbi:MAG TPA: (Fe-S)-binding protein [Tepidiformaceae bacterium]|nr:(Fe-S)-binding protein [Tepidiformaceae bacterium]